MSRAAALDDARDAAGGAAPAAEAPLRLVELPVPEPGPGQVLLRVLACGVCRTDLHILEGELPPHRSPVVPGHQIVGEVVALGPGAELVAPGGEPGAPPLAAGDRVGVPWLHQTDETCRFCRARAGEPVRARAVHRLGRRRRLRRVHGGAGRVRLPSAGRHDRHGGGPAAVRRHHRLPLPAAGRASSATTPGCRAAWPLAPAPAGRRRRPKRLAIYGFGSAASLCTQVAIWRGWEVYGIARDEEHRAMARELGAVWAGESDDDPGVLYDAAIVFAPAGELAVDALRRLDKGGVVALGGIYSSPIPPIEYPWIYHERVVRSVANSTRQDARELLRDAAAIPIVSRVQEYELEQANEALLDLKEDRVRGSAVLRVGARTDLRRSPGRASPRLSRRVGFPALPRREPRDDGPAGRYPRRS